MSFRRILPLLLLLPLAAWSQAPQPVSAAPLVSAAEAIQYQGARGFAEESEVRMRGAAPAIEILSPQPAADLKLKSPFPITVRFQPLADAGIVPSTLRILYGAMKFDITSRVAKFVQVTPSGFALDRAQLPVGRHKVVLQVQDEKQRVAERELRFEIE